MYKHILVPVDPSHEAVGARIVAVARHLAGEGGRITLLTVVETLPSYILSEVPAELLDENRDEALAHLRALARETGLPESAVELREGHPASTILEEAERLGADVIILGSHRPSFSDYLLGSTAARVVRHAQCTVVVERTIPINA